MSLMNKVFNRSNSSQQQETQCRGKTCEKPSGRIRIRHFYENEEFVEEKTSYEVREDTFEMETRLKRNKYGPLVCTIATQDNPDGTISVAFARVHSNEKPIRKMGMELAIGRLVNFQTTRKDSVKGENAFVTSHDELMDLIKTSAFSRRKSPVFSR